MQLDRTALIVALIMGTLPIFGSVIASILARRSQAVEEEKTRAEEEKTRAEAFSIQIAAAWTTADRYKAEVAALQAYVRDLIAFIRRANLTPPPPPVESVSDQDEDIKK